MMRSTGENPFEVTSVPRHRRNAGTDARAEAALSRAELAGVAAELRVSRCAPGTARARAGTLLATLRSLGSSSSETIDTISDHFGPRLEVLARYRQSSTAAHDLEMLIRDELREFQFGEDPRITLAGRIAWVQSAQAQPLALALHELTINALKFGALSQRGGQLQITWAVIAGELRIEWSETAVAVTQQARRHYGVGRAMIEQELPDRLDARTSFVLLPGGLNCQIAFPLDVSGGASRGVGASANVDQTLLQ